uniref:Uncharacterized protein n=2 Tax=Phaeomonas parva TaxID=124430 RepID=A0A7S1XVX7_9STRA|mmetsp:Transcript_42117/g.131916  ORF Transcript_42117/g.131916 Transcript_42117/m.131916 type:complete len:607 (+) Transcript_42117:598-2418(+)
MNDAHEMARGRYENMVLLTPEDKNYLFMLSVCRSNRGRLGYTSLDVALKDRLARNASRMDVPKFSEAENSDNAAGESGGADQAEGKPSPLKGETTGDESKKNGHNDEGEDGAANPAKRSKLGTDTDDSVWASNVMTEGSSKCADEPVGLPRGVTSKIGSAFRGFVTEFFSRCTLAHSFLSPEAVENCQRSILLTLEGVLPPLAERTTIGRAAVVLATSMAIAFSRIKNDAHIQAIVDLAQRQLPAPYEEWHLTNMRDGKSELLSFVLAADAVYPVALHCIMDELKERVWADVCVIEISNLLQRQPMRFQGWKTSEAKELLRDEEAGDDAEEAVDMHKRRCVQVAKVARYWMQKLSHLNLLRSKCVVRRYANFMDTLDALCYFCERALIYFAISFAGLVLTPGSDISDKLRRSLRACANNVRKFLSLHTADQKLDAYLFQYAVLRGTSGTKGSADGTNAPGSADKATGAAAAGPSPNQGTTEIVSGAPPSDDGFTTTSYLQSAIEFAVELHIFEKCIGQDYDVNSAEKMARMEQLLILSTSISANLEIGATAGTLGSAWRSGLGLGLGCRVGAKGCALGLRVAATLTRPLAASKAALLLNSNPGALP